MVSQADGPAVEVVGTERRQGFVVRVGGRDQSFVDLEDPTYLAFDYVRRMGDVLDAVAPPGATVRVLHVGGAGLTLPRYVAATRPGSWQVVLEPDGELTRLVRERLPLPRRSGIKVRDVDGETGLRAVRAGAVDVLVVDAYADGEVPRTLLTREHLGEVWRVLAPDGLYLLNLADRAPFTVTRDLVAAVREHTDAVAVGAEPATLRGRRPGNLTVLAGRRLPLDELAVRVAASAAPYRLLTGRQVGEHFGGGTPR